MITQGFPFQNGCDQEGTIQFLTATNCVMHHLQESSSRLPTTQLFMLWSNTTTRGHQGGTFPSECWSSTWHSKSTLHNSKVRGSWFSAQVTPHYTVVISQTHWLVSQERLCPRAGTSIFIMYKSDIWQMVVLTTGSGVSYHTPPPPGGTGLTDNF